MLRHAIVSGNIAGFESRSGEDMGLRASTNFLCKDSPERGDGWVFDSFFCCLISGPQLLISYQRFYSVFFLWLRNKLAPPESFEVICMSFCFYAICIFPIKSSSNSNSHIRVQTIQRTK